MAGVQGRMRTAWIVALVACGSQPPPPTKISVQPEPAPRVPSGPTCERSGTPQLDERHFGFGSHRREKGNEVCEPADDNLARVEDAILALPAPSTNPKKAPTGTPIGLALIDRRFQLTTAEKQHLGRDGFVVAQRLEQPSYAWAYHEIYQSQLPIFVSVDSILHALYASHDHLLANTERTTMAPLMIAMVARMHCALAGKHFSAELAADLDLYLTVARRLLEDKPIASALGTPGIDELVAAIKAAGPMREVAMFGRTRVVDFSQFQPRSHYTDDLAPYFRGAMWLERLEFNLVSRSSASSAPGLDARETPREERIALALAELAADAPELATLEALLTGLAGRREDVSIADLRGFQLDARDDDAPAKLRAAIGDRFQRTARIHFMPEGASELPAIATLLGPRIVPDALALRPLANTETPGRERVRAGDLAFLTGNDRGKRYTDLEKFPTLGRQLDKARELAQGAPHTPDLYTAWLDAIRALAVPAKGAVPRFMTTTAYADLRLDTTIAAIAQLKHDHVLIAGQAYGEGGCEIPDGYVEPAPEVYDAIARYAERGASVFGDSAYWQRLGKIAHVLAAISRLELANQPLPLEVKQWLSMVTEILPYGSDGRPTYTGWYFDLFDDRSDAIAHPDLIADYFTSGSTGGVAYVGVKPPSLGVFVVDTGGAPRAMVGPIAHAYEHEATGPRLTDASIVTGEAPWTASYELPATPAPTFRAAPGYEWPEDNSGGFLGITIEAPAALGAVTFTVLDHHNVAMGKPVSRTIGKGTTLVRLMPNKGGDDAVIAHAIHVQIGEFGADVEMMCMDGCRERGFGAMHVEPAPEE